MDLIVHLHRDLPQLKEMFEDLLQVGNDGVVHRKTKSFEI